MALFATTFLERSNSKLAAEIDGEIVLIGVDDGKYYGLDDIGSVIWKHLEEPVCVDALCRIMHERFAGDHETITRDMIAFLELLIERDVLIVSSMLGSDSNREPMLG